jgi:hypothetical protein
MQNAERGKWAIQGNVSVLLKLNKDPGLRTQKGNFPVMFIEQIAMLTKNTEKEWIESQSDVHCTKS